MYNRGNVRKLAFHSRGRSAQSLDAGAKGDSKDPKDPKDPQGPGDSRTFLQIRPALADHRALGPRSHSILGSGDAGRAEGALCLQAVGEGRVQLSRSLQEKGRLPDRITLDRRGLSSIPHIVGEPGLRLLSLQHNLVNSLAGLAGLELTRLVFLDVYDNQIDKITALDRLGSLRVLLMGKNRIRRIDGLTNLTKLEVLDLHGNRITRAGGLSSLAELKVLNLAGNQIKSIGTNDLQGLLELKELNLKRNRLRKLLGFQHTPKLMKLYLGNNDLQSVEDVAALAEASSLADVSLDNNPVALGGDCTPYLVSYLPNLLTLTNMHVTEQVRRAAMDWRANKEAAHAAYCALGGSSPHARRDQVIHNARTNWELLRSENRCFVPPTPARKDSELERTSPRTVDVALTDASVAEDSDCRNTSSDTRASSHSEPAKKSTPLRKLTRSATAKKPPERRVNFSERSASQDTDASTSTSGELRLPPILLPIISTLDGVKLGDGEVLKRWENISGEPVMDSSFSSLPSSSSESDAEQAGRAERLARAPTALRKRSTFGSVRSKSVCDPERRRKAKPVDSEIASNISSNGGGSVATNSSTSGSDQTTKSLRPESGRARSIRSATTTRRSERSASANRASTARAKSSKSLVAGLKAEPVPKPTAAALKDREQGVDYLVEVADGVVSAWGAGAVRRLARDWDWAKARSVATAAFHYVHFSAVAQALPELKNKFPNVSHISVRATGLQWLGQLHALAELRGLAALTVHPEGNPIHDKRWREYAVYRLAHWGLRRVNGEEVTAEEIKAANATYAGLGSLVLAAIPDAPLRPLLARLGRGGGGGARAWLRAADPALRDVIAKEALQYKKGHATQDEVAWRARGRAQLARAVGAACGAALRLRTLQLLWPELLVEMVERALRDFADMDEHVRALMAALVDSL